MPERPLDPRRTRERTAFETGQHYSPDLDFAADVAIVYGVDDTLRGRLGSWAAEGYICHCMTGVAWGDYQTYIFGAWDGANHEDEIQADRHGARITHGWNVYYVCPTESFARYLGERILSAVEAGATAIHLEEPEYWARAGYCAAFREEWLRFYGAPWSPPHETPDARYRASKLMYHLSHHALGAIMGDVRQRASASGRAVRFYVPTHSVLNYAHWSIVSPESSLARLEDCDGYIAQVWAGTARTPTVFRGRRTERPFETAFLEYGALTNLARASGQRMWFLVDPVEDDPRRTWVEYRSSWERTVVAALLWPEISRYEVMPWPERVLRGAYRPGAGEGDVAARADVVGIPPDYTTEVLVVAAALTDMDQVRVEWDCGTQRVGILVSDTMMFQRCEPDPSDPDLSFFYGIALPLLRAGIPVHPVQLEFASQPGFLSRYDVLFLSYEGQKPPSPECHQALRAWVDDGGVLVYLGDDQDGYETVLEWWNTPEMEYLSPREHLFEALGLHPDAHPGPHPGTHRLRKGGLVYQRVSPSVFAYAEDGPERVLRLTAQACRRGNTRFETQPHIVLRRGPYLVAVGVDRDAEAPRRILGGTWVDLFSPGLDVLVDPELGPGGLRFLLDVQGVEGPTDRVLCSGSRIYDQSRVGSEFSFTSVGPAGTTAVTRVRLSARPRSVHVPGCEGRCEARWHAPTRTVLLRYPNKPTGRPITINFAP
jgi:hypothetical protein